MEAVKIFTSEQLRELDAYTIKHEPIASIDLMERAAGAMFRQLGLWLEGSENIKVFCGPGNNGGDGLVMGRMLAEAGHKVEIYTPGFSSRRSEDFLINFERLEKQGKTDIKELSSGDKLPPINKGDIIIDALFGSGLSKPLSGDYASLVKHINASGADIVAVDIPSGLFAEDNSENDRTAIIKADISLSIQFPKLAFMFAENNEFVGNWHIVPIGLHEKAINNTKSSNFFTTDAYLENIKKERPRFSHKGNYGHALLISGCYGRMGAAVLAARAALRSGVGLLTTHVPTKGIGILQTTVPEAMLSIDQSDIIFSQPPVLEPYNAIGIGPALGCKNNSRKGLLELLKSAAIPMVIDADGINIIADEKGYLEQVPENSILTPHPKEFDRLAGPSSSAYERHSKQTALAVKHKLVIVLKGAYTAVACPNGSCWFNSTGNPGMATAGSGDVLTGIILGLLAQGYASGEAAKLGVFVHGLAGDIAEEQQGKEALIASDIIDNLGKAWF